MNKILITEWQGKILSALLLDNTVVEIHAEEPENPDGAGAIYQGRVLKIVSNIRAAFIEYLPGKNGYLDLRDISRPLKTGEEFPVMIGREAVKTKEPVLTSNLSFAGRYAVFTTEKPQISFSSKITDKEWKAGMREKTAARLEEWLKDMPGLSGGFILRTNSYGAPEDAVFEEMRMLASGAAELLRDAKHRTLYSCLRKSDSIYRNLCRDAVPGTEIITDLPDIFREIRENSSSPDVTLRLYEDSMVSLAAVYRLEHELERALSRRVLLKSGAYLVIDYTEAMTVIDVNSGKYSARKKLRDTVARINEEAASECMRQLRLRNLSGIILIDFIDMDEKEDREKLMKALREAARKDPVKTVIVDMTELNLVEITRKKVRRPLHEVLSGEFRRKPAQDEIN